MRTPCVQGQAQAAEILSVAVFNRRIGDRMSAGGDDTHFLPVAGMARDRLLDAHFTPGWATTTPGKVLPFHIVAGKQGREDLVRLIGFCHNKAARGILVQAVHDAGALHPLDTR
jgi:hypothetical protein